MQTGQYDGVSASGDATLRLIYGGDVAPVNTDAGAQLRRRRAVPEGPAWNSVNGQMYGIPHGWGANVLMCAPTTSTRRPTSWGACSTPNSPYKGKVTAYDSPIYIADAALYLMSDQARPRDHQPVRARRRSSSTAAVDLLKQQNAIIGEYWSDYLKEVQAFESGRRLVLGTTWQVIANIVQRRRAGAGRGDRAQRRGRPAGRTPG